MEINEKSDIQTVQVSRNPYRDTDETFPKLGFGGMRLPEKDGKIDREQAQKMVDYAMSCGVNYFDTAYMYHEGESETFLGHALAKYSRTSFFVADKMPTYMLTSEADCERIFEEQLRRTGLEYFDFYLMHWLNGAHWEIAKRYHVWDFLIRMREKGKIRRIGFSFHGDSDKLKEIAQTYPWDMVQIQLNCLDWEDCRASQQYEILTELKIPVAVMEPLKGGTLTRLCAESREIFRKANSDAPLASWGLRYAASLPNVLITLSGMSTLGQLEENVRTFAPFLPLNEEERETISAAMTAYRRSSPIPCTNCRYCAPCPQGVDIPCNLAIMNQLKDMAAGYGHLITIRNNYATIPAAQQASSCVSCGICETRCPQQIKISTHLHQMLEELKGAET
ncbi:MAG: aldo/keto reductase [Planctomycetia bacterium]|nr:aldo/keto reductase [Planctomycetia bacterium]